MSRRTSLLVFKQLLQPQVRHFNTKRITNSISFCSKEPFDIQASNDQNPAKLSPQHEGRKLAIILPWIHANEKAVQKYAQFYTSQDFDVITFRISIGQFLLPSYLEKTIKHQLLPLMLSCDHPQKVIHALSVGCYTYGRISKLIEDEDEKDKFLDTIKAQVWDSIGNLNHVSRGISLTLLPQTPYFAEKIEKAINFYLKKNPQSNYYFETQEYLDHHPIKTPALFLGSTADNVAPPEAAKQYKKLWQTEHGIPCSEYVWKDTKHVAHMRKYPHEYWEKVGNFLKNQGVDMDLHRYWQTQALTDNRQEKNILNA